MPGAGDRAKNRMLWDVMTMLYLEGLGMTWMMGVSRTAGPWHHGSRTIVCPQAKIQPRTRSFPHSEHFDTSLEPETR